MVTNPVGSITDGTHKALVQKLATLEGFEQAAGSFRFQILILRTSQYVEDCGTSRCHENEAPHRLLREPGRDFLRRQKRKF